jgi:tRNA(Ile)-lysidine synthase
MTPAPEEVARLRRDLDSLAGPEARLGIAVSGGPDSLALLLLAGAGPPGQIEAATVDHALRPGSRAEAEMVASLCARLGVPHAILTAEWADKPSTGIQERARAMRYKLLADWARTAGLGALVTAHHCDDQAETVLMRLARGSGVKGLAGMRPLSTVPGTNLPLLRPLLGWRRSELEQVCADAGLEPAADPSNHDQQFERVRVRRALADAHWLDAPAIARSAANLAMADSALHWATTQVWDRDVIASDREILFKPNGVPPEIRRRIVRRAVLKLACEGSAGELRGGELDRLLAALRSGGQATLRGVLCHGGKAWTFIPAPNRTRPVDKSR